MYIIDTNVLSALRKPKSSEGVRAWLLSKPESALFISVITLGEIERGIGLTQARDPVFARDLRSWLDATINLYADRILPFGSHEARLWGALSARLGHGGADLLIAATALAHGAIVATRNVSDFAPTGVVLENPFDGPQASAPRAQE